MKYLVLFILCLTGCIEPMPSQEEFQDLQSEEEAIAQEQAAQDAGQQAPEGPKTDAGPETPEPTVDAGSDTPEPVVDAGQEPEPTADAGVTLPQCGDGVVEGDEVCDDGSALNIGNYGGCNSDCTQAAYCGDGILDEADEACDDGAESNDGQYGGCNSDCTQAAYCGDGILDETDEACDDGTESNDGQYGGCNSNCTQAAYCGDGVWDSSDEACDDGNEVDNDRCSNDCILGEVLIYDPLVPFVKGSNFLALDSNTALSVTFTADFDSVLERMGIALQSMHAGDDDRSITIKISEQAGGSGDFNVVLDKTFTDSSAEGSSEGFLLNSDFGQICDLTIHGDDSDFSCHLTITQARTAPE